MKNLSIQNISKSYSKYAALNDVSLNFTAGQVHAVVGESGCGKTTLLRTIAGLLSPEAGSILHDDEDITHVAPEKRQMGLVFQDYALFPHLSVTQNIAYGLHKTPKSQRQQRVQELMATLEIEGMEKRYPHQLSGGQQQRVAIARALAPKPALMLFDEPFANLDPIRRDELRSVIKDLSKELGTTSIIVTHDMLDALSIGATINILREGKLVQSGKPQELLDNPADDYVKRLLGLKVEG